VSWQCAAASAGRTGWLKCSGSAPSGTSASLSTPTRPSTSSGWWTNANENPAVRLASSPDSATR
jgi:hypothetical protein